MDSRGLRARGSPAGSPVKSQKQSDLRSFFQGVSDIKSEDNSIDKTAALTTGILKRLPLGGSGGLDVDMADTPEVQTPAETGKNTLQGSFISNLHFELVTNDETPESWKKLIECKVLFGRQLPRMPKDYMCKLLFDKRHYIFGMYSADERKLLAVRSGEQVKGYGTRVMNSLKMFAAKQGVRDFVTYADVAAVGYFTKQGFFLTEKDKFPKEWNGHVKDYDGAHLMRCRVLPEVDYLNYSPFVKEMKTHIYQEALNHIQPKRYPGLKTRPARIEDIPGGPEISVQQISRSLEAQISDIIEATIQHKSSWPFLVPVDLKDAPDYPEVIQCPTDLSTMRKRNSQRGFRTADSFRMEMRLMFDNCYLYNGAGSVYSKEANALEKFVMPRIERLCKKDEDEKEEARRAEARRSKK